MVKRAMPSGKDLESKRRMKEGNKLPSPGTKKRESGLDEIDSMFSEKKKRTNEQDAEISREKKQKKKIGPSRRKGTQSLVEGIGGSSSEWVNDGLGGKINGEGFTGRVSEGVKVFKAHALNKPNFGNSKDCPFDCDCCYI
jgi:hypothetical protein